jgi:hypothetical protein
VQRLDHPLRDDLARPGHPLGRAAQRGGHHGWARDLLRRTARLRLSLRLSLWLSGLRGLRLGGRLSGLRRLGGRRLSGRRWLRGTLGAGGFDDVLLADAPADSGPGDGL